MFSACLVACLALAQQDQDRPTYRLDAKTEVVHGFRSTNRTTYTYFWSFKGQERELWRVTLDDKYHRHWIGRDGNVWVASERGLMLPSGTFGSTGDPQPDQVWVRSPDARDLAFVNLNRRYRLRTEVPGEQLPKSEIDWDSTGLTDFGPFNSQFKVVYKNLGELHINELRLTENPYQYLVTWNEGSSEQNALDQVVFSQNQIRSKRLPVRSESWELWSSNSPSVHLLTVFQNDEFDRHSNTRFVSRLVRLEREPTYIVQTPGGRVLVFTFYNGRVADLSVLNGAGDVLGEIDLAALGGFVFPQDPQNELDYTNIQTLRGNNWVTMAREKPVYSGQPERFKLMDYEGNQILFKVEGHDPGKAPVTAERLSAADFRLIKEQPMDGFRVVDERRWSSNSGEFVLRTRKIANDAGSTFHRLTLLHVDKKVESHYHEMWSDTEWAAPLDAFVTDTGRALVMSVDAIQYSSSRPIDEVATFRIRDFRNQSFGPVYSLKHERFAGSFEAAKRLSFKELSVEYGKPSEFQKQEDAIVPQVDIETFTWQFSEGRTLKFSLTQRGQGFYTFSWLEEALTAARSKCS